jgi:hypothetical protein
MVTGRYGLAAAAALNSTASPDTTKSVVDPRL